MALFTNSTKRSLDLIVPFTVGAVVFYDAIKKGGKDWKNAAIMCGIIIAIAYLVTTQVTRLLDDKQ